MRITGACTVLEPLHLPGGAHSGTVCVVNSTTDLFTDGSDIDGAKTITGGVVLIQLILRRGHASLVT